MKNLFILALLLLYQVGYSQQITLVQYWFGDNFAGRVPAIVTANANNEIIFDIAFPDNGTNELNEYFHCRFRDDVGNWSCIYSHQMNNNSDASTSQVKVQYWFDGNSPIGSPEITVNNILINGELNHQELDIPWPTNAQEIHYRFKSAYNKWSSIQTNTLDTVIYENNQIVEAQYWFGDNFNDRVPISITGNSNNEIVLDAFYPSNGINQLNETVHYRFKDAIGNWSSIFSQQITSPNTVVDNNIEVQYWFDDNFNPMNALVSLIPNMNGTELVNQEELVLPANTTWPENAQVIHYRFKGKYNQWTSIQSTNIDEIENKFNQIVELQWWLNNGFAGKTTIPVNHTGDAFLDIRDLTLNPNTENTIHVRYKDKMNRWSSIFSFFPEQPGITVLVHGFQATGEVVIDPIITDPLNDFKKIGAEIIKRAGGGVMFVNNPDNGQIEFVDNNNLDWGYPLNNKKEIVLVYDWRDLSNNLVVNIDFGSNGYLESAADNLLASIVNIPSALWGEAALLTKEQLLSKPKHFIAHSRGNIVTLQFLHRLATYFPDSKVDQFTLLDPHPATSFGDLNTENPISPPNLPCVYGVGTNCGVSGCINSNNVFLKIPSNVKVADNYYRFDGVYEGISGASSLFSFDGVSVPDLIGFNRALDENVLVLGANNFLGGTHSAVHEWYRGTINTTLNTAGSSIYPLLTSEETTTRWYSEGMTSNLTNNFLQTENRFTTGFNRSRIGGGEPIPEIPNQLKESLTDMNRSITLRYGFSLIDHPNGVHLHTVFGGYFDNNNDAGWNKNGGLSTDTPINFGRAQIQNVPFFHSVLKHSLMYFPENYNFLKINVYEATALFNVNQLSLKVTFFDNQNNSIGAPTIVPLYQSDSEQYIPLPNNLIGEVGTFQIEYDNNNTGSFFVDEVKLTEFGPNGYCDDTTTWVSTTDYPNGTWTNGKPVYGSNAIISHNFTSDFGNTTDNTITACALTVNNGAIVKIEDGFNVKLNGAIKVNSGTFTLNNNASLIQNSTEFPNVGAITVKRNTNALMRLDYTMWSSPVENQPLFSFSPSTLHNRFYTYNPNNNFYETVPFSENTIFADANGYLIRMPNNHPTVPTIWEGQFFGVPHNGRFELNVTDDTYNAIGNPYPSPIDADLFISENNLTEAIYFWRKTNNSANPSYATYTFAGGAGTAPNTGGGSDLIPNGFIQIGQGFIAKATSNKLTFTNAMRIADNQNQFFRTMQERSRIWLNLTNTDGFFSQTMIAYMPNATNEFDAAIDGHFLKYEPTKLSSLIGNEEFVIQGRATFEISDIVPLGFRSEIAGNYTIAIDSSDGLFSNGQTIYLKDNLLNIEHNLTNAAYTFNTDSGLFNSRFEIHYQPTLSTQNTTLLNNNVIVYKQKENIVIDSNRINIINAKVFDVSGRLLLEKKNVNDKHIEFNLETANQVLIVKVLTLDELITTKKILN